MATALKPLWTREQFARLAARSALTLAVACLLLELLAAGGYRLGWWAVQLAFVTLTFSAWGGVAAALLGIAGCVFDPCSRRVLLIAGAALVVAAAASGVPGWYAWRANNLPPIHDITTDIGNPPEFMAVQAKREAARNIPVEEPAKVAELQRKFYPDIAPLMLELPAEVAFARALEAAREMGWEIVAQSPAAFRIEATDTTRFMGFKDDVVIRITATGQGSRVDVRSASRVGRSDLGTNAGRIRAYFRGLREEVREKRSRR